MPWEWLIVLLSGLAIAAGAYFYLQETEDDDAPPVARDAPRSRPPSSAFDAGRARASLRELDGIGQVGSILGTDEDGVPTLQVFADVTSRGFALFDDAVLPELLRRYVERGRLRIQLRTLPGDTPFEDQAARWTQAAGLQTKLWDFARVLAAFGGDAASQRDLRLAAGRVSGLDPAPLDREGGGERVTRAIERAEEMANEAGVTSTPAFTVTNGTQTERVEVPRLSDRFADALRAALERLERG
jgi:hypothetical protein